MAKFRQPLTLEASGLVLRSKITHSHIPGISLTLFASLALQHSTVRLNRQLAHTFKNLSFSSLLDLSFQLPFACRLKRIFYFLFARICHEALPIKSYFLFHCLIGIFYKLIITFSSYNSLSGVCSAICC